MKLKSQTYCSNCGRKKKLHGRSDYRFVPISATRICCVDHTACMERLTKRLRSGDFRFPVPILIPTKESYSRSELLGDE